ncbi:MAG: 4'-phosphopantetheinyl transferase superfamily protein [Desulfococcaceae bacterium]
MNSNETVEKLFPVILSVPSEEYRKLAVRERVKFLSRYARQALMISEQLTVNSEQLSVNSYQLAVGSWQLAEKPVDGHRLYFRDYIMENRELPKNEKGAPMPVNGRWWSVTHKPDYVGAVVSSKPAGIDIEKISLRSERLWEKIADNTEKAMTDSGQAESFFRYWTAKEAVLKAAGTGLTELSQCRIAKVPDADHLIIRYRDRNWYVEHFRLAEYIASAVKDSSPLEWHMFPSVPRSLSDSSGISSTLLM